MSRASWRLLLAVLVLAAITAWSTLPFNDQRVHAYILDVGQGDAILLKAGTFEVLVDGGPDQRLSVLLGSILPPWDRTIEVVVLSHAHADHVTGLVDVMEKYDVGEVWGTGSRYGSQVYLQFLKQVELKSLPYRVIKQNDHFDFAQFDADILYPPAALEGGEQDPNRVSVVMRVYGVGWSILLPGDLEEREQQQIVGESLQTEILKVPHHGSDGADDDEFLRKADPKLAIISAGKNNCYGHPHQAMLDHYQALGIPVLRTDADGTVNITFSSHEHWIKTSKTGKIFKINP